MSKKITFLNATAITILLIASHLCGYIEKEPLSELDSYIFQSPNLWLTKQSSLLEDFTQGEIPPELIAEWRGFKLNENVTMKMYFDRITGKPSTIFGEGIPWFLQCHRIDPETGTIINCTHDVPISAGVSKALDLLNEYPNLFSIDPNNLIVNEGLSGPISDYLYHVWFDFYYNGIYVEKAHLSFHVNHGNLVQFGQEYISDSIYELNTTPTIDRVEAQQKLWDYIGGKLPNDILLNEGSLSIIPVSTDEVLQGILVPPGTGLSYKLVYTISFIRKGSIGTWEAKIDAHTGKILSFQDINFYGQVKGGVCLYNNAEEYILPFPYAKIVIDSQPIYSDSQGYFPQNQGKCKLWGKYAKIYSGYPFDDYGTGCNQEKYDYDEEIELYADDNGIINFLTSPKNDCSTPVDQDGNPIGGVGNTKSARTSYWYVTKMMNKASSYYDNKCFQVPQTVFVNNKNYCQGAFAAGAEDKPILLFQSNEENGYTCFSSGEIKGAIIHEFGHAMDCYLHKHDINICDKSIGSTCTTTFPPEVTADWIAALETRDSCSGRGWISNTVKCSEHGAACTECNGGRELDYTKYDYGEIDHTPIEPEPWTVKNNRNDADTSITKIWGPCPADSAISPCGWEPHCESIITTQALWDLVNRYLTDKMYLNSAWQLVERLFYHALPQITNMYTCTNDSNIYDTNGCDEGSLFWQLLLADDDDGNLENGTPHADSIFSALNDHLIACNAIPQYSECPDLSAPPLEGFATKNNNTLYWQGVDLATRYIIYKNELDCDHGFQKLDETGDTCYVDEQVTPGITYYYQIQAIFDTEACSGPVSNCIVIEAEVGDACSAPAPPKIIGATGKCNGIELSFKPSNCGDVQSYNIYRAEGDCNANFEKIATIQAQDSTDPITYLDTSVEEGISYAYQITASCSPQGTPESPLSQCLLATKKTPPSSPTLLSVMDDCASLNLSWSGVDEAQAYYVLRRNEGCGEDGWEIIANIISETEYSDENVEPGGTYAYSIQGSNECGLSTMSNCITGTHAAPDISGSVKEILDNTITGETTIEYIGGVEIFESHGKLDSTYSDLDGHYDFVDVQGGDYNIKACRSEVFEDQEYQVCYNPLSGINVNVCKENITDQDFWRQETVLAFTGEIMGPIDGTIPVDVAAYSPDYYKHTYTNLVGEYAFLLPSGNYKIVPGANCYVADPPYIEQTVLDEPISGINFQLLDWNICDKCYATLYRRQEDCNLVIDHEVCKNEAIMDFKNCIIAKTRTVNSSLYQAIVLSVEVQRATGQPEWHSYPFEVTHEGDYFITVTNGDLFHQESACSSAEINVDPYGNVFNPSDFNKNIFKLKKPIHLTPGAYTLNAILRSQPGCYITMVISDRDISSFQELP